MKRIKYAALILCCCLTLSACGDKLSNNSQSSTPKSSVETPTPSGTSDNKEQPPLNHSLDQLVQEADFTKNEPFQFPKLNEELLGEMAKIYNNKIIEIYETIKESYEVQKGEPYYDDITDTTKYYAFIDEERGWFSIVSNYLDPRGYSAFEPITLDLRNENRAIALSTVLDAYGWTEDEVRSKTEDYFKRMYVWDRTSHEKNVHSGEVSSLSLDEFLEQRMSALNEDLKDGLPFSIGENGITIYFISGFPTFQETYEDSLLLQKTAVEELLNNPIYGSPVAIIHQVTNKDRQLANIIENIHTDESGEEKLIMVLRNDFLLKIEQVKYDEKEGVYVVEKELFNQTMSKGEAVSLKTKLSEGFANIQVSGQYLFNPDNKDEIYKVNHPLLKHGLYGDPNIELLQGTFDY